MTDCTIKVVGIAESCLLESDCGIMADIKRAPEPDDPNRCQGVTPQGQCPNLATRTEDGEYGNFCLAHGGNRFVQTKKEQSIRNYQLDKFKAKLNRHVGSSALKSLRDEIAILRMIMEERLNKCNDETDLLLNSGAISDLVLKIEKLVSSCHKLEGSMGELMDKSAILQFAGEVINIIGTVVTDEQQIELVGNQIMAAVGRIGDNEDEGI